jgi:hypothetical protein
VRGFFFCGPPRTAVLMATDRRDARRTFPKEQVVNRCRAPRENHHAIGLRPREGVAVARPRVGHGKLMARNESGPGKAGEANRSRHCTG